MEGVGLPIYAPAHPHSRPPSLLWGPGQGFPRLNPFFFKVYYYYWLRWVFVVAGSLSLVVMHGLITAVASLIAEHRL